MKHVTRKAMLALAIALAVLVPVAGPAAAGSKTHGKSSGQTASVEWVEYGTLPGGVAGNVHVGFLFVDKSSRAGADVFGAVTDWSCDEGEVPGGGGHGEHGFDEDEPEPVENLCDLESERYISNESATFTMNRKGTKASLVGPLRVEGHDGGGSAFPAANITWTAIGSPSRYRAVESFSDGTYSYTYRYTFSGSEAAIAGSIGAMGFVDDADDEYSAWMGTYRNMYRDRVR